MCVSDDNMADALIWAESGQNGVDMGIKQRPGVNDCDIAGADNISAGAGEGKRAGVIGNNAPNER